MNFGIGNLNLNQPNININAQQNPSVQVQSVPVASSAQSSSTLSPGSIVSGQIADVQGDTVTLRLSNNQMMQARLDEGVSVVKGNIMTFEAAGNGNGQTVLRALFQNTASGINTMSAALAAAGISENANSYGMVKTMMDDGLPIDKNSLQAMYKEVVDHPSLSGESVVTMSKLQIPMTEANIKQFQAYQNLEHQISQGVRNVTDSMMEAFDQMVAKDGPKAGVSFLNQALQAFSEQDEMLAVQNQDAKSQIDNSFLGKLSKELGAFLSEEENTDGAVKEGTKESATVDGKVIIADNMQETAGNAKASLDPFEALKAAIAKASANMEEEASEKSVDAEGAAKDTTDGQNINGNVNEKAEGSQNLPDKQQVLSNLKNLLQEFKDENIPANQRMHRIASFLGGKDIQSLLKNEMENQWLMKPEMVADKEDVQEFYEKLRQQTGKLAQSLANLAPENSQLLEQVTNIRDNVEFMNQLSQTVNYVQLPLKLQGENAHGDLYVYTNKKNLAQKDGNVSAFLHLDMDHLGPVDVYVAMQNNKVSTNFYLKDDEMIDLICENIDMLNSRLEAKGYNMNCKVQLKEKPGNVMEEIMEDQKDTMLISKQAFDVRA